MMEFFRRIDDAISDLPISFVMAILLVAVAGGVIFLEISHAQKQEALVHGH